MTDEEALLRAVIAEPDDLDVRLVFADWYEAQGDSRCNFIRLQVALSRLPNPHPWREEFEQKIRELYQRYRRRWNAPLYRKLNQTPLKGQVRARRAAVRGWEYRRGFVEVVKVNAADFPRCADVLFELGPVREARLYRVREAIPALARCRGLRRLHALDLRQNELTADDLAALLQSPHLCELRRLNLSQNRLRDAGAVLLSETKVLPRLEQLYLWGEWLSEEPILRLQARYGLGVHVRKPYEEEDDVWAPRKYYSYDDHLAYEDGKALADGVEVAEPGSSPNEDGYDAEWDYDQLIFRDEWDDPNQEPLDRRRPDEAAFDWEDEYDG